MRRSYVATAVGRSFGRGREAVENGEPSGRSATGNIVWVVVCDGRAVGTVFCGPRPWCVTPPA